MSNTPSSPKSNSERKTLVIKKSTPLPQKPTRPASSKTRFKTAQSKKSIAQHNSELQHLKFQTHGLDGSISDITKSPSQSPETKLRLNKHLAALQFCSRREADTWISNGWVLVNGETASVGQQVHITDALHIEPAAYKAQSQQLTILLNKPIGYVSAQAEDGHSAAVKLLTKTNHWSQDVNKKHLIPSNLKCFAPAGRLDIDSTGLLVLTQDGRVARAIIGQNSLVEKEYLVRVSYQYEGLRVERDIQSIFPTQKLKLLRHGLSLDGVALQPAEVDWQNPEQLRFILREGKKRQIRRMCEQVGLHVTGLKRIRIGNVLLGNLPIGQWRYLLPHESFSSNLFVAKIKY